MSSARFLVGDVFDRLAEIPDASVDLVMTSPPFLALRSYLPADHPDKGREIGSEPTPAAFLDTLLALTAEWRRVLAPHGSICVELGDTFSGSGGAGGDYGPVGLRAGAPGFDGSASRQRTPGGDERGSRRLGAEPYGPRKMTPDWPLDKSLCGIPTLYAWSLAYGRNLLTGEPSPAGQWRVRNLVVWCRPNPPVGALGDKFRPATSYLTVACVGRSRYFDLDAVRTPHTEPEHATVNRKDARNAENPRVGWTTDGVAVQNPAGAPPLDWWEIPTQPYAGSHYATWPEALLTKPIQAMSPQKVCRVCGKPSERITENHTERYDLIVPKVAPEVNGMPATGAGHFSVRDVTTLGWSDCGHDNWRRGMVCDPFAGSGTTLAVAVGHGRDAIGIDLDPRNADLARERCGMFLTVEEPSPYLSERPTVDVPPSQEIA